MLGMCSCGITESLMLEKTFRTKSNHQPAPLSSPLTMSSSATPTCFLNTSGMVIPRILGTIRGDLPSLKLSAEMPAELQATKHNLEKACADGSMERF